MKETIGEKKDYEIDSNAKERSRRTLYGLTFVGGLLLSAAGSSVVAAESPEADTDPHTRSELYEDGEISHYDFLTEEVCEISYVEGESASAFILEESERDMPVSDGLENIGSLMEPVGENQGSDESIIEQTIEHPNDRLVDDVLQGEVKGILMYEKDYIPKNLLHLSEYNIQVHNKDIQISKDALPSLLGFINEAKELGYTIGVASGYRSYEEQEELNKKNPVGAKAAGRSQHQSGFAVDLYVIDVDEGNRWLSFKTLPESLIPIAERWGLIRPLAWDTPHFFIASAISPQLISKLQESGYDINPKDPSDYSTYYAINGILNALKESEEMQGESDLGEERDMESNDGYGMEEVPEVFGSQEEEQKREGETIQFYNEGVDELTSYTAILSAVEEFEGKPYSWNNENHHCSGYVSQYFKYLGFSIDRDLTPVSEYSPQKGDPMPNSTTVKQVPYLKMIAENYGRDLALEIPLKEMLTNKDIWEEIPAGTVLYLPERIGHHGYDTFTHTAIFMGLDPDQEPMFSEFSVYMKEGPEYGHGFEQFTRMYRGQNIEPYNSGNGELKVFMFNAVEASRRVKLARRAVGRGFSNKVFSEGEVFIK
jgi:hypothetical protein